MFQTTNQLIDVSLSSATCHAVKKRCFHAAQLELPRIPTVIINQSQRFNIGLTILINDFNDQ